MMRNLNGRQIAILLLSAVIAFALSLTGCDDGASLSADVSENVAGVEYYHYDAGDFNDMCDELEELAGEDDADAVIQTYDALYDEIEELESLYAVIYVMYASNVTDEYYTKEQLYTYNRMTKCSDRLCEVCSMITEGPCADAFREHVGKRAFRIFSNYSVMTKREQKLIRREKRLIDDYYDVIDASESMTYKYKGKEWTFDMISGLEGEELVSSDYDGYVRVYDGLMKKINGKAGPIYLELVQLRTELANLHGYDDYASFADREEYNRDYSAKEIRQLHKDVKKVAKIYYDNYYMSYEESTLDTSMSVKKLLTGLQKCSGGIDEMTAESMQQLLDESLISIGDEEGRQDGAFTTYIYSAECPFISMTLEGQRDFLTLSHEFGHFVEYNNEKHNNILTDSDNVDLAEIASNGLQGLMTRYYDEVYRSKAEAARKDTINDLLENVIDGCIEDEFQRAIYKDPDMTLDEINRLYADIESQYSSWMEDDPGYSWVLIGHTFESPMYYISYTVSGLAALQIWNRSNRDFEKGVKTWEKVIREGTYNKTYMNVIDRCGLIRFTEKGAVQKICKPALKLTSPKLDMDYDFEN